MELLSIGTRVRETAYHDRQGSIRAVDTSDPLMTYSVKWDGEDSEMWVYTREIEAVPDGAASDRESFVTRAKALLADTDHTGADVVAMAAFLAGD
ncbi:hypothetical protein [Streptomyces xanthophaeus]